MGHISESQRQSRNLQSDGDKGGSCQTIKRELDESGGGLELEVTMEQLSEQLSKEKSRR